MNKADKVKQKLIKEVVIPSLLGVLIALLFIGCSKTYRSYRRQYPSNDRHCIFCFREKYLNSFS